MTPTVYRPRPRSKPLSPTVPAHRRKCLAVAHARIVGGMTVRQVRDELGCSRASVFYWTNLALTYPEGQYLRRLKSA